MRSIGDGDRRKLATFSAMLCAMPLILAPLTGRSSFEIAGEREMYNQRFKLPVATSVRHPLVTISKDPFVPDAREPNAHLKRGHGATVVRAIVSGDSVRALIESNGKVRVVGLGDQIDGAAVVGIDSRGLRLADGTALPLSGELP